MRITGHFLCPRLLLGDIELKFDMAFPQIGSRTVNMEFYIE